MTTKDIIQLLPFGEEFKTKLLADFDTLTPDQKFNIVQTVWDAYNAFYQLRLEENTQEALLHAADGEEALDKDFYKRIKEKTDQEMKTQLHQATTTSDLSSAREELEKILKQAN